MYASPDPSYPNTDPLHAFPESLYARISPHSPFQRLCGANSEPLNARTVSQTASIETLYASDDLLHSFHDTLHARNKPFIIVVRICKVESKRVVALSETF